MSQCAHFVSGEVKRPTLLSVSDDEGLVFYLTQQLRLLNISFFITENCS